MYENVLDKRDNENEFEHHKRLVYGKLKDKTLVDYDYGELSKYLYGKELAPDETRKRMYGSYRTLELLDGSVIEPITDSKILDELESKKIELQKEKQRFFDQRREFNKLVNKEGRMEHLFDILGAAAKDLTQKDIDIRPSKLFDKAGDSENEAVIVLADWHYGMVTDNLWNKFDTDICRRRVQTVLENAIERIHTHNCSVANIVLLGDMFAGSIHIASRVASEELVCNQLMEVSEILAQFILEISDHVQSVNVYATFGNHGRTVQVKEDNLHMDNMERIIPWWLKQRVAAEAAATGSGKNITINYEDKYELVVFSVCGYTFCATHGDLDNVKNAPRMLATLLNKTFYVDLDYVLLGHSHHGESFEELGVESIMCGSICGTDEYANNKRLYAEPTQLMLIVNPNNGIDARYKLRCEH